MVEVEMAHTPGPWWSESGVIHARGPGWTEKNHSCIHVATAHFPEGVSLEVGYENASLMAAAPDLLAACELALHAFEENWCINWDDLRRAIEKAKGE
jgi:hypothetical protein